MKWPWIEISAVLISLLAALGTIGLERTLPVLIVLLLVPAFEVMAPRRMASPWPGIIAAVSVFLLGLETQDQMAMLAGVILLRLTRDRAPRGFILGGILLILGGDPGNQLVFALSSVAFAILLIIWFSFRRREALDKLGGSARKPGRVLLRTILHGMVSIAIGLGTASLLPKLQAWLIDSALMPESPRTTGFGTITDLNSVSSLHQSQRMALRLFSRIPRYLRGQVYAKYRAGRWLIPKPGIRRKIHDEDMVAQSPSDDTEVIESLLSGSRFVFLPLEATDVRVTGVNLSRDATGMCRVVGGEVETYSYSRPRGASGPGVLTEPDEEGRDLDVPEEIADTLRKHALEWSSGKTDPFDKATDLVSIFTRDFEYTLSPGLPGDQEPILRFLEDTRAGHCEYFASAMTLMLRSIGVRARYVSGFSLSERNELGDYWVARDSDAHAWVEVHHPKIGWRIFDPTPPNWKEASGPGPRHRWLLDLADFIFYSLDKGRRLISSLIDLLVEPLSRRVSWRVLLPSCAFFALVWWLWRRQKRRGLGLTLPPGQLGAGFSRELREVEFMRDGIDSRLEKLGLTRTSAMTVLELERRLHLTAVSPGIQAALSALVATYCRWRYREDPYDGSEATRLLQDLDRELSDARSRQADSGSRPH